MLRRPRALVIGAGGFLGHHLVRRLCDEGWAVVALMRAVDSEHTRRRVACWPDSVDVVIGTANDANLIARLVVSCAAVFPFAGQSGAATSMRRPLQDHRLNSLPHLILLEAIRAQNPSVRVVFPGSRLQYGRVTRLPVPESSPLRPTSLYGLHKTVAEGYYRIYHELYGMRTTCLRISIPYGARQDRPDRAFGIVGNFLAAAVKDDGLEVFGGGHQLRDCVYVDDLVDLLLLCVTHPAAVGGVYNASGRQPISVRTMANTIIEVVQQGRIVEKEWPSLESKIETGDYWGDTQRVTDELGWKPTTSFRSGLQQIIQLSPLSLSSVALSTLA